MCVSVGRICAFTQAENSSSSAGRTASHRHFPFLVIFSAHPGGASAEFFVQQLASSWPVILQWSHLFVLWGEKFLLGGRLLRGGESSSEPDTSRRFDLLPSIAGMARTKEMTSFLIGDSFGMDSLRSRTRASRAGLGRPVASASWAYAFRPSRNAIVLACLSARLF